MRSVYRVGDWGGQVMYRVGDWGGQVMYRVGDCVRQHALEEDIAHLVSPATM